MWLSKYKNLYIGRRNHYVGVKESKWKNPFPTGKKYTIDESLALYKKHVFDSELIHDIDELRGKNLGCWCVTDTNTLCHGNVLVELLNEKNF